MHIAIDLKRFENLPPLQYGAHFKNEVNMCVMEAVAYVTHKEWSDHPPCVCPVIGAFMRAWNDGLPDDESRTRLLKPLIPKLINTRGSKKLEQRRATMATDWLVREHAVAWLRLARLDAAADAIASLPEITDFANRPPLKLALEAARKDAAAARAGAWGAARTAAWDVAGAAARAATGDAARDVVGDVATDVARDVATDAAWAAAKKRLQPTQALLQKSALSLVSRMIAATD